MIHAPPPPVDGDDSEDSDDSDSSSVAAQPAVQARSTGWHSDEEEDYGPRRTTGSGPRYPNLPPRLRALQQEQERYQGHPRDVDEDSEDESSDEGEGWFYGDPRPAQRQKFMPLPTMRPPMPLAA